LERDQKVDYLVVETTGLADPLPIILTFLRSEFRDRLRLDAIVTIVDAENFSVDLFDSQAAYNQLRYADFILLNKCDLTGEASLNAVEAKICRIKPGARVVRTTRSAVPLPLVLSVGLFDPDRYLDDPMVREADGHEHLATDGFGAVSFASD